MKKISVYTILYYDLQFYEDIIKYLYDVVDEFIIIDGPYSYAMDTLKKYNLFYDEQTKPRELNELIEKYSKIKYKYVICDTEEEKRMIGYNMCSNDLVLLVDTDEFLSIDTKKLNTFINQPNKFVGCANIYNMCDYNVAFNNMAKKYILFKKIKISALEHLDYTWLVGCKQNEKKMEYMSSNEIGTMYHLTLNRSKQNNTIKFIFYVLLFRKQKNQEYHLLDKYKNEVLTQRMTIHEILNLFVHAYKNRINIPTQGDNLQQMEDNDVILSLKKYEKNNLDFCFTTEMKCLLNVPVCIRLSEHKKKYTITFENVESITVTLYYLYIGAEPKKQIYTYTNVSNTIEVFNEKVSDEFEKDAKYMYMELHCNKTCNEDFIYTIKTIV